MTKSEIEKLKALCEKTTPGPWEMFEVADEDEGSIYCVGFHKHERGYFDMDSSLILRKEDAEFIAAARTAVPELIAEVERLQSEFCRGHKYVLGPCFGIETCSICGERRAWKSSQKIREVLEEE